MDEQDDDLTAMEALPAKPKRVWKKRKRLEHPKKVKSTTGLVTDPKNPMPKGHGGIGVKLTREQRNAAVHTLLHQIERGRMPSQVVRLVAKRYGKHEGSIWKLLSKYRRPTTKAATWYLRTQAFAMAQNIVEKGSPADHIDVLSRPNIGVLEPIKKVGGEGGSGLFISVQVGSCGGVASVGPSILSARAPQEITDGEVSSEGWAGEDGEPQRG